MKPYRHVLLYALLIIFVSIGLGRFSFGMILPNLQEDLQISTTLSGFIGTSNFIGYFIGIFFVSYLYKKYESAHMLFSILLLQALSMFAMAFSTNYLTASLLYAFTGAFSAISNVSIMVYISHIVPEKLRGKALGIVVTGIGLGIILSGFYVPIIESIVEQASWRVSCVTFALITLIVAFMVKQGIKPDEHKNDHAKAERFTTALRNRDFWKISFIYVIFGMTYVVFVTYFVFASMDKYDLAIANSGYFWSLLGFMSLISGPLFGSIADRIGAYKTLIIVYSLLMIANLILALDVPSGMLILSAIAFGISAWSVPSLVALLTSLHFGKHRTAQIFSMITILFAAGQTIGPVFSGYVYDVSHSFDVVFLLCALLCLLGVFFSFIFSKSKTLSP